MISMLAVIRIRGTERIAQQKEDTFRALNLTKPNHCVLIADTPEIKGMILKVKDYVTWGEVDQKIVDKLEKLGSAKKIGKAKVLVRLNPPRKGFGRKGVKLGFNQGGALGYRGAKINTLLENMLIGSEMSRGQTPIKTEKMIAKAVK